MADFGPWASPRSKRNALHDSTRSEWAEITHPFHPLRGQQFLILKTRRVAGVETLILRGTAGGTFAVARDWTDRAQPHPCTGPGLPAAILDVPTLLALTDLLTQIASSSPKGVDT